MSTKIKVKFKKIDNTQCEIEFEKDTPIEEVRKALAANASINIPAGEQRLLYKAKLLKDGQMLSNYVTEDQETIHVIQKPTAAQMGAAGQATASTPASSGASQPGQQAGFQPAGPRPGGPPPGFPGAGAGGPPPGFPPGFPFPGGPPGGQAGGPPNLGGMFAQMMGGMGGPPGAGGPGGAPPGMPPHLQGLLQGLMRPPAAGGSGAAAGADGPQVNVMMGDLLGGIGDISSLLGQQMRQGARPPQQNQQQNAAQPAQAAPQQSSSAPSQAPQARAATASSQPASASAPAGQQQVMQLPHQVLVRLGQVCNHMQGPGASFPGPPMPQIQVERNMVVLLGSYLTNMNLQLQRLSPLMSRTGDLMQREGQLNGEAERQLTQQMANDLGQAMEDISRATGSVAHFYKTLEMGSSGAQAKVQVQGNEAAFQAIIDQVGSVRSVNRPAGAAANEDMQSSLTNQEESKQQDGGDVDFSSLPNPISEISDVVSQQEMQMIFMGVNDAVNHVPQKMQDHLKKKKEMYKGSFQKYAEHIYITLSESMVNDGVMDMIYEGFDPTIALQDPLEKHLVNVFHKIMSINSNLDWASFSEQLKPTMVKSLGETIEELADGFQNGEEGVFKFFSTNMMEYYKKTLPPEQMAFAAMKVGPVLFIVKGQYQQYKDNKQFYNTLSSSVPSATAQVQAAPQFQTSTPSAPKTNVEDAVMKDESKPVEVIQPKAVVKKEEKKEEVKQQEPVQQITPLVATPPTSGAGGLAALAGFKAIIQADKARMKEMDHQNPQSRAYMSTCSFSKDKRAPIAEEKLLAKEWQGDGKKALAEIDAEKVVRDQIRRNLITGGGFAQAKVEETLSKVDEIPQELVEAYVKMQRNLIKYRIANDDDWAKSQSANSPNDANQFEHLKKF